MFLKTPSRKTFWLSLKFFSAFRAPDFEKVTRRELSAAFAWSPVVGLLFGLILAAGLWLVAALGVHSTMSGVIAALLLLVWIALYKGLHLDGLADFGDAWLGGFGNHQRALTIMKDSRVGTGGVIFLVGGLLLKWQLLAVVVTFYLENADLKNPNPFGQYLPLLLLFIPAFARFVAWRLMFIQPYAGLTPFHKQLFRYWSHPRLRHINNRYYRVVAALLTLALIALLGFSFSNESKTFANALNDLEIWILIVFSVAGYLAFLGISLVLFRGFCQRLIGGINGDAVGTQIELAEVAGLLYWAAWFNFYVF